MAVPRLRQLASSLSLWRPRFNSGPVYAGLLVEQLALRQLFLQELWFSDQYHSTDVRTHSFMYH